MNSSKRLVRNRAIPWLLMTASIATLGCENAGQGAVSGAGIGALSGLAIGSLTGNAGKGAAIGAIAGGVGGAVIGDQNKRKNEAAAQQPPLPVVVQQPTQTVIVTQQTYVTGQPLGRLIGQWRINGTIDSNSRTPLPVYGTARGSVDKVYFVRLDINFTDPRTAVPVQGTSIISQTGGRGVEMTNSFSSSPTVNQFRGTMDASGTVFDLKQFDPPYSSGRVNIRLSTGNQWTAEVWDGHTRKESYTFTWVGP